MKKENETITKRCLMAILVAGVSATILAGCGSSGALEVDQEDAIITITNNGDDTEPTVGIANPWIDTTKEGVIEATGLNIYTPQEATNAQYSYMTTSNMAQVTFEMYGNDGWTFRKQKADMLMDISGLYYEWVNQESTQVAGKEAMLYAYVEGADDSGMIDNLYGVQLINWYDDTTGITYSLSVAGTDLNGMDLEVIAQNLFALENE